MRPLKTALSDTLIYTALAAACFSLACAAPASSNGQEASAQQTDKRMDKRKLTTIQTSTVDAGQTKNAVEVRYLNLPFGEATFGYMEKGGDRYYSNRTWPIAHLTLATPATYDGKTLQPGDYVMIITPKGNSNPDGMKLSIASFKPENGTFLRAGDVFTDTPKDATVISQKPVAFDKGAPMVDHLVIDLDKTDNSTVAIKFHYGDRTLTEKLMLQ